MSGAGAGETGETIGTAGMGTVGSAVVSVFLGTGGGAFAALASPSEVAVPAHVKAQRALARFGRLPGGAGGAQLTPNFGARLDEIAEKFDPHREAIQRHKHVENPAAHRIGSGVFTDGRSGVSALRQSLDGLIAIQLLFRSDDVDEVCKRSLGHHFARQRFDGSDHDLRRQHAGL